MPDRPVALGTQDDRILASMSDVAFSPDGSTLLTAARSGLARTWDTRTGREAATGTGCSRPPLEPACLAARTLDAHGGGALTRAAYSPNGRLAATSSVQGSLVIWDMATAERVSRPADVPRPVDDIAFSPDGTRLATAERDGTTRLLDPATGALVREFRDPDGRSTEAVAFGAGGDLMTANEGGLVRRWDGAGHPRVLADVHEKVLRLALDPTGRLVALGTTSRIVLVDLADGHTVHTLLGHSGLVTGVGFTPDGALLVSGGKDGTVRVWDAESGDQAAQFAVPGGGVSQLAVDVAGRRIAVVTDRGSGAVIDCEACRSPADLARLADVRATRDLTDEERANFDAS
jgi:WD40 repeat protein